MLGKVNKKLEVTRRKVSKEWSKYRTAKKHILHLKRLAPEFKKGLLEEKRAIARGNISIKYEEYRGYKFGVTHKSDIENFSYVNKYQTINSIQKTYKARKGIGEKRLDKNIEKILGKEDVNGVLAILKVKDEESGKIMYISDFITKNSLQRLKDNNTTIYEHVAGHARGLKSTQEFKELGIYIKIIYTKGKEKR